MKSAWHCNRLPRDAGQRFPCGGFSGPAVSSPEQPGLILELTISVAESWDISVWIALRLREIKLSRLILISLFQKFISLQQESLKRK